MPPKLLATEATKKILSQSLGFRKSKAVKAISDVPGNTVAKEMYDKLGFAETGEVEDGELFMVRKL